MSGSISSLFWPWGNRSCHSLQKSNRERIALDFFKKERRQWFACDSSESLSKTSDSLEKNISLICFWQFFPFICQKSKSLYKRATVSDSHRSLMTKEWRSDSIFFTSKLSFDHKKASDSFEKTYDRIPNTAYKSTTLAPKMTYFQLKETVTW